MVKIKRTKAHRRQGDGLAAFLGFVCLFGMLMYLLLQDDNLSGTEVISTPARHGDDQGNSNYEHSGMRILYIVTSSNEFNTGDKKTKEGQDRFLEILVPALVEGVESMIPEYKVDVYLILGYTLSEDRQGALQELLPKGVGLQVWNEATPIGYDQKTPTTKHVFLSGKDRTLARQHRYVVKDKFPYYDFFLAYEDDMLITKSHIEYFMDVTQEIIAYKKELAGDKDTPSSNKESFWGGHDHRSIGSYPTRIFTSRGLDGSRTAHPTRCRSHSGLCSGATGPSRVLSYQPCGTPRGTRPSISYG
jgi:hypothetical protein